MDLTKLLGFLVCRMLQKNQKKFISVDVSIVKKPHYVMEHIIPFKEISAK